MFATSPPYSSSNANAITEFGEGPAAISFEIVHAWDPKVLHGLSLDLFVEATIAANLDDQVQRFIKTISIVDLYNEIRQIAARVLPER
nr:hypothetical protein [Phyllobacterium endophyticum]